MIDIADIPGLLRRKLAWLVLGPLVAIPLALVFVALKTPAYEASTELLVEAEGLQILATRPLSGVPTQSIQAPDLDSQAYILLSAAVLNDVADKLDLDNDPELHRPRLLARLLGSAPSGHKSATEKRAATIGALRERVDAERLDQSFVFEITATHPNAEMAAAIANETANSYIAQSSQDRSDALSRVSTSLSKQASALRTRVEAAEAAVESYKAREGLISTGDAGLVVDQQLESLNSQITQAQVDLERAKATYDLVAPLTPADVEAGGIPQTAQTSVLNSLRVQYARIARQEAEAATTLGANHPTLLEVRSQLANTERQIGSELQRIKRTLKSQYDQAETTLSALNAQSRALQSENSAQGKALVELRQLQSEAEASRAVYEAFLKRARELEDQPEFDTNGSRVLSQAAVPAKPTGPSNLVVILAAGIFGLAVPAGLAVASAIFGGQITSERDLVRRTGVPIISLLPAAPALQSPVTGSLANRLSGRGQSVDARISFALTRIAFALQQAYGDQSRANILVLSTGPTFNATGLSRQIAAHLHDLGENVLFARTNDTNPATIPLGLPDKRAPKTAPGIGILTDHAERAAAATPRPTNSLAQYVSFEQLDTHADNAGGGALLSSNQDFLLVDGGTADHSPVLPVLLKHCDGILLISAVGKTRIGDLNRTLAYLQPWQDRVIGNVVLDAA